MAWHQGIGLDNGTRSGKGKGGGSWHRDGSSHLMSTYELCAFCVMTPSALNAKTFKKSILIFEKKCINFPVPFTFL